MKSFSNINLSDEIFVEKMIPGPRALLVINLPNRNITNRSYSCTTWNNIMVSLKILSTMNTKNSSTTKRIENQIKIWIQLFFISLSFSKKKLLLTTFFVSNIFLLKFLEIHKKSNNGKKNVLNEINERSNMKP